MSTWRRRAMELFPDLAPDLRRGPSSPYDLFLTLRARAERAHAAGDETELEKIYSFAEWASRQRSKDLWNPAGVAFYEHIVENPVTLERVIPWLSPYVIRRHWDLWEVSLGDKWPPVRKKLEAKLAAAPESPKNDPWRW